MAKPPKMTRAQIREGLDQIPMDTLLLGTAARQAGAALTPKQREFARLLSLGESKAQSYRKAYNSKGKATTAAREGHELSRNPNISAMTEAFAQAQRFAESHTPAQLRAFVVQQLTHHAANAEKPSDQLRALQLLGTVAEIGAFVDRKEVVTIKASGDIRQRITEKLKLIGASSTVEHNAIQDDAQDADSLLQELEGTGVEPQEGDPTPPGTPLNRGVFAGEDAHIIPHNESPNTQESIPHIQSQDVDASPHDQSEHTDVDDGVLVSLSADSNPSIDTDTGLEPTAEGEVIHNLTSNV